MKIEAPWKNGKDLRVEGWGPRSLGLQSSNKIQIKSGKLGSNWKRMKIQDPILGQWFFREGRGLR